MKGLMIKDLRLLGQQKKLGIIYVVMALFLSLSMDNSFLVSYLPMIGVLLVFSTISYDEYDNGMPFLMTMPLSGKIYAVEKYLLSFIGIAVSWTVALVLQIGSMMIKKEEFDALHLIGTDAVSIVVFLLVVSLMIPIELKFGAEKGRLMIFAIFAVVAVIVMAGMKAVNFVKDRLGIDVEALAEKIKNTPMALLAVICFGITAVLLAISMAISTGIMKKKEY